MVPLILVPRFVKSWVMCDYEKKTFIRECHGMGKLLYLRNLSVIGQTRQSPDHSVVTTKSEICCGIMSIMRYICRFYILILFIRILFIRILLI